MRTSIWTSIFPERFIPLPVPITEIKLYVPKPKDLKTIDKFPDLWKWITIQSLIPEIGYTEIPFDMYSPTIQIDIPKRTCKDCEEYFTSGAAVKRHRKGNGSAGFLKVDDGNASENEEELNVEFQRKDVENSASHTAPILNIFEILTQVPFIDDDNWWQ